MNRRLEQIVVNRDNALRELERFRDNKQILVDLDFNDAQIASMEQEKINQFDEANNVFWKEIERISLFYEIENLLGRNLPDHSIVSQLEDMMRGKNGEGISNDVQD